MIYIMICIMIYNDIIYILYRYIYIYTINVYIMIHIYVFIYTYVNTYDPKDSPPPSLAMKVPRVDTRLWMLHPK